MTRREKEHVLSELEDKFTRAQAAILADFQGLTVAEMSKLRKMAREAGVEFEVVKNTLAALAAKKVGIEELQHLFVGPTGIAFGYEDPVAPAKTIAQFNRDRRNEVAFKGGYLSGRLIDIDEVKRLAALPSRQELLGTVAGTLQAPIAALQRCFVGNLRGLAIVINRYAEKQAAAS